MVNRTCSVPECESPHKSRGYCGRHYQLWYKKGDAQAPVKKYYKSGEKSLEFSEKTHRVGECLEWLGVLTRGGYARFKADGEWVMVHRWIYEKKVGPIPDGMQIDHLCHNRRCVEVSHLRLATPMQNSENKSGARVDSGTGVRGVRKEGNKYRAVVSSNHKKHNLGLFDTIEEADRAAQEMRSRLMTHSQN